MLHNGNILGTTANDFGRMDTAASLAQNSSAATALRCFPREPIFGTRTTTVLVAWEDEREHDHEGGIFGALFGRPGADQAPSSSGALHGFDRSCTMVLVSASTLARAFGRRVQRNVNEISRRSRG